MPRDRGADAGAAQAAVLSDHFDGELFFNPHATAPRARGAYRRWRRERRATRVEWPARVADPPQPPPRLPDPGTVAVTFIGHSTFWVGLPGFAFLTDPIWSARASPVRWAGPRRARPPGQRLQDIPVVDAVLCSHCHYDHLDLPTLRRIRRRWSPPAVTPLGNARHFAKAGLRAVSELDWWHAVTLGPARITCVPAQHFSARTLWDRNRALWGGFVVQSGGAVVYFAGDSGWSPDFAEIGRRFPRIDLAFLPIGAYEPRWFMRTQHMDPAEAVQAHLALRPHRSVAMHFGTFQLTDEGIDAPARALRAALAEAGIPEAAFQVMDFGATAFFPLGVDRPGR